MIKKVRGKTGDVERRLAKEFVVEVKGNRFEVDLVEMTKRPIYWDDKKESFVRR